jgi:antitoxin ParD1/3/4
MAMPQNTMNVALPETMKEFVRQQIAEGGYSTASEYVRELIRADQQRKASQRLDTLLLEGIESGSARLTKKDMRDIRSQVAARLKHGRKK